MQEAYDKLLAGKCPQEPQCPPTGCPCSCVCHGKPLDKLSKPTAERDRIVAEVKRQCAEELRQITETARDRATIDGSAFVVPLYELERLADRWQRDATAAAQGEK